MTWFHSNKLGIVILAACIVIVGLGVYVIRKPVLNAKKIQIGDSQERVHQIMGQPTEFYNNTAELRDSILSPMSYVFSNLSNTVRGIEADDLPPIVKRAEWFEWLSAGTIVYYDENGVTEIYWGGT